MASYKYAFSLSKEEVRNAKPPGTVVLISHDLETPQHEEIHGHIRLEPQPSADPADPLNWPLWRKHAILASMCLWAWNGNFQSAGLASALPTMIMAFPPVPKTFPQLTHLLSVNVLFIGISNIWWVPLANTFGRRPVVLLGALMLTVFSVWAATAKSYNSLLAARCFMGMAAGSSETIAPDILGEVFFVHQRGRAMALYTVFLALGPLVAGTVGSYIAAMNGWRWINWINAIFAAGALVSCFFFQPETLFDRAKAMGTTRNGVSPTDDKGHASAIESVHSDQSFRPYTFTRSLGMKVYRGGLFRKTLAPFLTLRFPGVWMVMLQYAGLVACVVTISIVGAQLVSEPPYLWGKNAGLINIGAIVGVLLGALYTFLVADRVLTRQAKHEKHGFGEPEARLVTQFPGLFVATFGIWIFGAVAAHPSAGRWVGLQFGYGMLSFGLMQVPSVGFNYIIEAYNAVSGDCFVMIIVVRSIISFAWTFFVGNWIDSNGPMEPFGIFGMLMGVFTLLTVPMYIWGKRTRIATAKWVPEEVDH